MKGLREKNTVDPGLIEKRSELARKIAAHIDVEGPLVTAVPGLRLSRRGSPSECYSAAYEPELVVFAQGEKRITVGGATHVCDGSNFLLTSIDLPVVSQITKASRDEPFLGLALKLQMPVVREILSQEEFLASQVSFEARGMAVGKTSIEMLSACCRLLDLLALLPWRHAAGDDRQHACRGAARHRTSDGSGARDGGFCRALRLTLRGA